MLNYNIHWKGYPQYRLPRIRVVSSRRASIHSRSASTSGNISRTHSKSQTKNEKENINPPFRIQFLRRRVRGSRASSSVARARRRASTRAKHHREVFGWDSPGAELASKATTEENESRKEFLPRNSRSGVALLPKHDNSEIPSTDGAANSVARQSKSMKISEKGYSLGYVAKVPIYWTANQPSTRHGSSYNPERLYSAQRSGPLQAASNRIPSRRPTEASQRNDTIIGSLSPIASQRRITSSRPQFKPIRFRRATSPVSPARKDTELSSPEFWEAVQDYSRKSKIKGTSASSVRSIVQSLVSEAASRTPSQNKVLQRFTRGLELYLQAAKDHPSQSLIPSPPPVSSRSVSAYTLQELKPYRSEFQSAGLAVTSAEQKGMAKLKKDSTPPPTPQKDRTYDKSRSLPSKKSADTRKQTEKAKQPSYASGSTGTTVLGWTPPHEKSYGRPPKVERRRSSNSTDHTIIGFTPPHLVYASPPKPAREAPAPPQATTKKSLPWLRKSGPSPEASPTQKMSLTSVKPVQPVENRPSTPLTGWVPTFDVLDPVQPVKKQSEPQARPRSTKRPTEAKWEDYEYGTAKSTADNFISKMVTEMATPTGPLVNIPLENLELIRPRVEYSDSATQTVELSSLVPRRSTVPDDQSEHLPEIDRAPLPSDRSKTFSLNTNNRQGDCVQPLEKDSSQLLSRPSKVTWTGVDQEIQTAEMPVDPKVNPERVATQNFQTQPSFQSNAIQGERTRTFPFATSPMRRIGPYQPPRVFKSLNKSMDEGKARSMQNDRQQEEEIPLQSQRVSHASPPQHSPPPLCTQCAGPLSRKLEPELKPEPNSEADVQASTHTCTARSSTQCQQCFPSRNSSIAVSPLQATSPPEPRPPVEVRYLPSRRSTRPIIPTGSVHYPEDSLTPVETEIDFVDALKTYRTPERRRAQSRAEPSVANAPHSFESPETTRTQSKVEHSRLNTPKSYDSPERTRTQSKAEKLIEVYTNSEPMADPMKRPSLPRLKLKPIGSETPEHVHCYSTVSRPKTLPPMPNIPVVKMIPFPASASTVSTDSCSIKSTGVNDKQVFKGLQVATAAACDEDVDKWIEEITGSSTRKFLSVLSAFDGLGANTLAGVARRAAKERRQKVNAWEVVRELRVAEEYQRPSREEGEFIGVEYVMSDQGVEMAYRYPEVAGEHDWEDEEHMVYDQGVRKESAGLTQRRTDGKGSESIRERPVKMDWRDRSVGGGV